PDRPQRLRRRPGQEGQADPRLPDDDWPQLRRGAAGDRLAPADGEAQGRDAGELAAGRGRDHRRLGLGRRGEGDLPRGLEVAAALHPHRAAAVVSRALGVLVGTALLFGATPALAAAPTYSVGRITDVSASCSGQNAEVEQGVDPKLGYVYETWMGCRGIAFARSADGGRSFETPISVPGSLGSNLNTWDPAVTVAPDGTVYAVFMVTHSAGWYPVVAASFDHGVT